MIRRLLRWRIGQATPLRGYAMAVLLAAAAQVARMPLDPPTLIPYITYVPFILLSAALGGFGPGLLTTAICLFESEHFATGPLGREARLWGGLGSLAVTGLVASTLFHSLRLARRRTVAVAAAAEKLARDWETRGRVLESIIQSSPTAIALVAGPEFTFVMVNPAYEDLIPGETKLGRTVAEVWGEAAPAMVSILAQVRAAGTVYSAAGVALPAGSGLPEDERHFDFSYIPAPAIPAPVDGQEDDRRILVVATETTGQRRAERALRTAYSRLAAIHACAPVAFLVADERLQIQVANEMAAQLAGKDIATMLAGSLGAAICSVDAAGLQCPIERAASDTLLSGTRHDDVEAWLTRDTGGQCERLCLLVSTIALRPDPARKVLICLQDITGRKRAEAELARQRDELRRRAELIDSSHDAILTLDDGGVIRGWNRGAEEMYGWTEAEAVGNAVHPLLLTGASLSTAQIDEALARDGQWDGEIRHTRRDGRRILVESRQVLLRETAGTDIRVLEINRDITERRSAEDELRRTLRQLQAALAEKTVLLKEIHHRVKNNLAVTASLLSLRAENCGPEARAMLEESRQRVHSIALVHEHLYDNDRLDRIDFAEYALDLVQGVRTAFGGDDRGIELDLALDPIQLGIDRAVPCALILNELLSNAFKYAFAGKSGGRIRVSFRQPEPGRCELAVEDNGVGMPDGALLGHGTSLGLRIVAILTSQLDGSVEQKPGPGARILLRFPAS